MGAYNKKGFSKEYSIRTEKNYNYIKKMVHKDERIAEAKEKILEKYEAALENIDDIVVGIREATKETVKDEEKAKNPLNQKLFSIAKELDTAKKDFVKDILRIENTEEMNGDNLYEVTQLINSLMGLAVLPYEMHKEYFKYTNDAERSENNRGKSLNAIQKNVKNTSVYDELKEEIKKLYNQGKWYSTYPNDLRNGYINEERFVFSFLGHIRNTVCHSGNNAMSILPLSEGAVIEEILFYDHDHFNDSNNEFAMCLSIDELEKLVQKIINFYRLSEIGESDKTIQMQETEERVRTLLRRNSNANNEVNVDE